MKFNPKKILFFNAKRDKCFSVSPHLGIAMLAAVLKEHGHEVLVVDYQFKHDAPSPETFVKEYNPDIIGLTLYTATVREADKILSEISHFNLPIMVGGPHASLYFEELIGKVDYIILGEAENVIVNIVENATNQSESQIIQSKPPNPKFLPYPDFTTFYEYKDIVDYPLLTSRGCPYNCSFCLIHIVSTKKWRPRNPADCVQELIDAKNKLPNLKSVIIYDDNPMFRKHHIKTFINLYFKEKISLPLNIINTRADSLDEEIISLLKKVNCPSIAIGVESGHPEVFKKIKKGESLKDIEQSAKLIKKYNIPLSLCFIIGLEEDSLEKTKISVNFAKKLKPDHIYWNMITPFKGTQIRKWYNENGRVFNLINHSSWVDGDFMCEEPCAETPEFTVEQRKKAYVLAILKTNDTRLNLMDIRQLLPYITRYNLYYEFLCWIPIQFSKDLNFGKKIIIEEGFTGLYNRIKHYF